MVGKACDAVEPKVKELGREYSLREPIQLAPLLDRAWSQPGYDPWCGLEYKPDAAGGQHEAFCLPSSSVRVTGDVFNHGLQISREH